MNIKHKTYIFIISVLVVIVTLSLSTLRKTEAEKLQDARIEVMQNVINAIIEIRIVRSKIKLHTKAKPSDINDQEFMKDAEYRAIPESCV